MDRFLKDLREKELRAKERLSHVEDKRFYCALLGLKMDEDLLVLHPSARISRVVDAPGEIELAAAISDFRRYGSLARYAPVVQLELAVDWTDSDEATLAIGAIITTAIRIRTLAEFLVPAATDYSWSNLCGLKNRECSVWMLEDYPTFRPLEPARSLTAADADWIGRNTSQIAILGSKEEAFRLASESLCFHQHLSNLRMMVAMLWSGIEAVFGFTSELRFRLASVIAAVLESPGERRRELYREIKRLYDFRSKLVHGGTADEEAVKNHVIQVRRILSRLLCIVIEQGLWKESQIEGALFG